MPASTPLALWLRATGVLNPPWEAREAVTAPDEPRLRVSVEGETARLKLAVLAAGERRSE